MAVVLKQGKLFKVIEYDCSDNSYLLSDVTMKQQAQKLSNRLDPIPSVCSSVVYAKCNSKLKVGEVYEGIFNFPVTDSILRGELPVFTLKKTTVKKNKGFANKQKIWK